MNFQKIESGEKLYMGNVSSSMVESKGDVVLNLTSWKDFKNYLNHKRKELSMEDLIA